jgi:hypothetical protein
MKCKAGIGKQSFVNYNWGWVYMNKVVLVEGLDMFRLGDIAAGRMMIPSQFASCEINVGWMDAGELNR